LRQRVVMLALCFFLLLHLAAAAAAAADGRIDFAYAPGDVVLWYGDYAVVWQCTPQWVGVERDDLPLDLLSQPHYHLLLHTPDPPFGLPDNSQRTAFAAESTLERVHPPIDQVRNGQLTSMFKAFDPGQGRYLAWESAPLRDGSMSALVFDETIAKTSSCRTSANLQRWESDLDAFN
jgi:hypothetical protein